MSDTSTAQGQQEPQSAPSDTSGQQSQQQPVGQAPESQQDSGDSLYDAYLSEIPDEVQRKLMEPHAKRWDGMVTQRFQKIRDEYKPFKESGLTADTVSRAAQLYQMLETNPQQVFTGLAQALGYAHLLQQGQQQSQYPQQAQPQGSSVPPSTLPSEFDELDPVVAQHIQTLNERYEQQSTMLNNIAQLLVAREKSQQEAQQQAQLDFELQSLRQKHGNFDENYVLTQMYAGMTGEQAVQAYKAAIQQAVNAAQTQQPSPPFMGGGAAPPQETFDPRKAKDGDVKNLVAGLVSAAQQA